MIERVYLVCSGQNGHLLSLANDTAERLLLEDCAIGAVYCGPHVNSVQTLMPIVYRLDGEAQERPLEARVEYGFRDWQSFDDAAWLCADKCAYKRPPSVARLQKKFDFLDGAYHSYDLQHPGGVKFELISEMVFRVAFALDCIMKAHSRAGDAKAILICTTEPVLNAIAAILTDKHSLVNRFDNDMPVHLWIKQLVKDSVSLAYWGLLDRRFDFAPFTISSLERPPFAARRVAWEMRMNGNRDHITGPVADLDYWRFKESAIWSPSPILELIHFFQGLHIHLPRLDMTLWWQTATYWISITADCFADNRFGLPALLYFFLLVGMVVAIIIQMHGIYYEEELKVAQTVALIFLPYSFLFPPNLATRHRHE